MLRLLIVLPAYVVFASLLPQWTALRPAFEALLQVPHDLAVSISAAALLVSALLIGAILYRQRGSGGIAPRSPLMAILWMGLVGTAFAATYDLFQALGGRAVAPVGLVIVPLAFLASEALYQGILAVAGRASRQKPAAAQPEAAAGSAETGSGLRLLVTIPVYVFVIVFLPELPDYQRLVAPLDAVYPATAAGLSAAALVLSGSAIHWLRRDSGARLAGLSPLSAVILMSGLTGLVFAGLLNLLGYLTGYAPELSDLIVIPAGFAAAELIWTAIRRRMTRGPAEL